MALTVAHEEAFARHLIKTMVGGASGSLVDRVCRNRPRDFFFVGAVWPERWDVPDDEAGYELKKEHESRLEVPSIGFDCLIDGSAAADALLTLQTNLRCYYRVLPSWQEVQELTRWEAPRRERLPDGTYHDAGPRKADLPVVFQAMDVSIDPLDVPILDLMRSQKDLVVDLGDKLKAAWEREIAGRHDVYPGRKQHQIEEADVATEADYDEWRRRLNGSPTYPDWAPRLELRPGRLILDTDHTLLRVLLVNGSRDQRRGDGPRVFDQVLFAVSLTASLPTAVCRPMTFEPLPKSYRYDRSMPCHGINCHAWAVAEADRTVFKTDPAPTVERARLVARTEGVPDPTFEALRTDPIDLLRRISAAMRDYRDRDWAPRAERYSGLELDEFNRDLRGFDDEIERFDAGIGALVASAPDSPIRRAFDLMNETFRRHGLSTARPYRSWRLFQMVFIVSQIPMLVAREARGQPSTEIECADVIWAPTGGGKTEAYLGLLVLHLFFDRLRGKHAGVTAILRFPLRLLTLDQFQRVARVLGVAETVRRESAIAGDPFAVANWVGEAGSPNRLKPEHLEVLERSPEEANARWCKLAACPFCGNASVAVAYDARRHVLGHRCGSVDCSWPEEWLPVHVVDYEIYRYLPSVIVATVDKLAAATYNRRFANLFGAVNEYCPIHGYGFCGDNDGCQATNCCLASAPEHPLHDPPPALQIQDELHLLKEELGVFDSHYETFCLQVQETLGLGLQPHWKVIAATATIEDYERHVGQLYLLESRRFPGPGPTWDQSFYAHSLDDQVGRFYVGILGMGRAHTNIVVELLRLYHGEINRLWRVWHTDANALRAELGQQFTDTDPQDLERLLLLYEVALTYVLTKKGGDQVGEVLENRVNRALRDADPEADEVISRLLTGSVSTAQVSAIKEEIENPPAHSRPGQRVRSVIATNMISHGVDIERFNLMLFGGMPRQMAEYIQASSRVGRAHPGIVICAVTPHRERDRSHYHLFRKFHDYLDLLVEPAAINRWSEQATRRTLGGVVLGYILNVLSRQWGRRTDEFATMHEAFGASGKLDELSTSEWASRAYRTQRSPCPDDLDALIQSEVARLLSAFSSVTGTTSSHIYALFPFMRSLRDVEEDITFLSTRTESHALSATLKTMRSSR